MKKSTIVILLWTLCLTLLWTVLMFAGVEFFVQHIEKNFLAQIRVVLLLVPSVTGCCAFYAVVKLRGSWRAWTGYIAAAIALMLFVSLTALFAFYMFVGGMMWSVVKQSEQADARAKAAVSTLAPEQFMDFLQHRKNAYAVPELMRRPEFTPEMLHQATLIFLSDLKKQNAYLRQFKQLRQQRIYFGLGAVARHPNVDMPTLLLLAEIPNPSVQSGVASQRKTPVEILRRLSLENNQWIKLSLARNPNTPTDILHDLANSSDDLIRSEVAGNPNASAEDLRMLAKKFQRSVAGNPGAPADVLNDFADSTSQNPLSPDFSIRSTLVQNPNLSARALSTLAKDRIMGYLVAKHPNTSAETLTELSQVEKILVRVAVLKNPNCPEEIKEGMIERLRNEPDDQYGSAKKYFEGI